MIGKQIAGRYSIVRRLGGGGMGVVYQALDTLLGRDVAVKVLRSHLSEDDAFRRRFAREGRSAASLSHPNIVQMYDVGETPEGVPYIVMEYVEGETLEHRIRERGALSEAEAVDIARQVASALVEAHRRGVVHRDIKPLNILVTPDGRAKVADFGIARAATGATLVNTGTIVGSAHYVSPEQARGGFVDEKTDVYSLGVVLYEMLTGRTPFQGETAIAVALKHLQEDVLPPSDVRDVSPETEAIVLKALEKDPMRRYASALAMLEDLQAAQEELRNPSPVRRKRRRRPKEAGRGRRWLGVSGAILLAALLAGGAYAYARYRLPPAITLDSLVNQPLLTAEARLHRVGLTWKVERPVPSLSVAPGAVVRTFPRPGGRLVKGQEVELYPSGGPPQVPGGVPDVRGQLLLDARQELVGLGLKVGGVTRRPSSIYGSGEVSDTVPAPGTPIRVGQPVELVVSSGAAPASVLMPNLVGRSLAEWKAALTKAGLTPSSIQYGLSQGPVGTVLSQSPSPGTSVGPGSSISLTLSPGVGGVSPSLPGVVQQQTATITMPLNIQANTAVMIKVISPSGSHVWDITRAGPGQVLTVTYQWQGKGTMQVWIGGQVARELPLPIEAGNATP